MPAGDAADKCAAEAQNICANGSAHSRGASLSDTSGGDAARWDSSALQGLVVASCAVRSQNDEMLSMWIAASINGRAKDALAKLPYDQ